MMVGRRGWRGPRGMSEGVCRGGEFGDLPLFKEKIEDLFLVGDLYPPDIPPEAYLSNLPNLPNPLLTLYPQDRHPAQSGY